MGIRALWLGASALAFGVCGVAAAQTTTSTPPKGASSTTVTDVVITAERRTTNLQTTAIAATVLTQKDLLQRGVFKVDQLQFVSPSLTVNNFGQGDDFDIRGIGKGEHNTQTSTGVVTYRDGVATFPGYITEEPYFDVSNVEVLRGPQGTFSGQNATGGAVIVTTQDPQIGGGYDGYLLAHYGNYNDTGVQGAVNLPISDTFAARIAFNGDYKDSFYHITGPWTGNPNLYWGSARLSLLWTPTSSLKVSFKTDYDYLANGGYFGDAILDSAGTGPNPTDHLFNFANNYNTYATDKLLRSVLRIDYVTDGGITLRSVTGYQKGQSAWNGDIDGTAAASPNYIIDERVNEQEVSQEFNVISPEKGFFTWVLGAYYNSNNYSFPNFDIGVPPGQVDERLAGDNLTYTDAVFGQASFNLPHGFQVQAGLRYSYWSTVNHVAFFVPEYAIDFPDNQKETGQNLTGKVTLNWNIDRNNFVYAFVATGAKPGGLNTPGYFDGGYLPAPFKQEYVTDYEVGWKARLFDDHVRTQVGFYYNDFNNFQVIVPLPNDPVLSTELNNPSSTVLYGFEASAQAVFGDFSFNAGLGLEHSAVGTFYTEDPRVMTSTVVCNVTTGPATSACINLKGHPQTYAPDVTFNLGGQYNFHLGDGDLLTPAVNFSYISSQWGFLFDNRSKGDYLGPRAVLGASLAWTHGPYVATLYGYNLTDDQYISALLPPIRLAGAPRQFGISVMKTF